MSKIIKIEDIPTSYYGIPTNKEHLKIIHSKLISVPCKVCGAQIGEGCKNLTKGVHMGRVPDNFDSVFFLVEYFNKNLDEYYKTTL